MKPPEYQVLRCGFDRKDDHKKLTKETLNVVCAFFSLLFSNESPSLKYEQNPTKRYECVDASGIFE